MGKRATCVLTCHDNYLKVSRQKDKFEKQAAFLLRRVTHDNECITRNIILQSVKNHNWIYFLLGNATLLLIILNSTV